MDTVRSTTKSLSPLFRMAILSGVSSALKPHLQRGENVNATDAEGRTPLILSAYRGHLEICRILLEAGADPAILGGTADYISRLFSSTPTIDTQNKIKSTLEAIRTVSVNKANEEIDRQRKIALRNKNYNPQDVETALDFPEFKGKTKGSRTITLKSGKTVTVVEE